MKKEKTKVKSKYNNDIYYVDDPVYTKYIDGTAFVRVKKTAQSKESFFMLKENLEFIK